MNAQLARRGPDGGGVFEEPGLGIAMRRLSIIDLGGGSQPIFNEDRSIAVVMNGEIYNYRTLRSQLLQRGHRFSSASDTEVLVHLYEDHGPNLVRFLEGMFAFAIWDRSRGRLLIARDRLGIKPLYYAAHNNSLIFASEIKSLLAFGGIDTTLDYAALDQYFSFNYIPAPRSIYASVRKLPAGSLMDVARDGTYTISRYWSPPEAPARGLGARESLTAVASALDSAVESHLVSDVPVGAFLSGGIDSGLIVAIAAQKLGKPLCTFTIGFRNSGRTFLDERPFAREIAQRYGCDHHEIEVDPDVAGIFNDILMAFDEPFADDSVIPSYYVSQVARTHVKVALSGLGGDELFAGYRRHLGIAIDERMSRSTAILRALLRGPAQWIPEAWATDDLVDHVKRFVRGGGTPAQRYSDFVHAQSPDHRRAMYSQRFRSLLAPSEADNDVVARAFAEPRRGTALQRALHADLMTYLPDDVLTLSDRLSMWHSLELRVPFLDRHLLETSLRIPDRQKIRGLQQKYALREIAKDLLPASVINHRKQGFEAPMGSWLRGPLREFLERHVNERTIREQDLLDWPVIKRLKDEHLEGTHKHSKVLFSVLTICAWMDKQGAAATA